MSSRDLALRIVVGLALVVVAAVLVATTFFGETRVAEVPQLPIVESELERQMAEAPGTTAAPPQVVVVESRPGPPMVPEIPQDQLPPRTRSAPDPAEQQYRRQETVSVRVAERVHPSDGKDYVPEVKVVENYLSEYFRRAGYAVLPTSEEVTYRIEGDVVADFADFLTFREQIIAWKYHCSVDVRVLDQKRQEVETIVIEDLDHVNARDEETCVLDLRRYVAKLLHDRLFLKGEVFTNAEITALFDALVVDPLETEDPRSGEAVIHRLVDIGFPAVPYLLEALTDDRVVFAWTPYPGLENPDELKVYHVADKALEEVFQKVSRMHLKAKSHERYVMILGWQNEWRRFCPTFRDSPQRARRERAGP